MRIIMRLHIIILSATFLFPSLQIFAQRVTCDETCKIEFQKPADEFNPTVAESDKVNYAVVCPVGTGTVKMIDMAPRLETLDGKTIAIVGGSFMASITHPELKRLILEHYPTAKVILLDEIGSAGVYPAPGVTRRAKDEFQRRLREMNVDAVISGNCGCGLCTPKEVALVSRQNISASPLWLSRLPDL